MTDTSPEMAALVQKRMMERSGEERFMMGVRMFDAARKIMIASFPKGLNERDWKRMVYERTYGEPAPVDFPRELTT